MTIPGVYHPFINEISCAIEDSIKKATGANIWASSHQDRIVLHGKKTDVDKAIAHVEELWSKMVRVSFVMWQSQVEMKNYYVKPRYMGMWFVTFSHYCPRLSAC